MATITITATDTLGIGSRRMPRLAIRTALLVSAIVIEIAAGRVTLGLALAARQPMLALTLDPGSPLAASEGAQQLVAGKNAQALSAADALARTALSRDPTLTPAIETSAVALKSR